MSIEQDRAPPSARDTATFSAEVETRERRKEDEDEDEDPEEVLRFWRELQFI